MNTRIGRSLTPAKSRQERAIARTGPGSSRTPPVDVGPRTFSLLRRPRCPRRTCPEGQPRRPRRRGATSGVTASHVVPRPLGSNRSRGPPVRPGHEYVPRREGWRTCPPAPRPASRRAYTALRTVRPSIGERFCPLDLFPGTLDAPGAELSARLPRPRSSARRAARRSLAVGAAGDAVEVGEGGLRRRSRALASPRSALPAPTRFP